MKIPRSWGREICTVKKHGHLIVCVRNNALMLAIKKGKDKIVHILVSGGTDLKSKNNDGYYDTLTP